MRSTTLIITMLACVWLAHSPAVKADARLDSLKNIVDGQKKDLAYIQALNELSAVLQTSDAKLALSYADEAISLAEASEALKELDEAYLMRSTILENIGEFKGSYEAYQKYVQFKDSLFNQEKSKEIGKLEAKFEFEKAEEERKHEAAEQARILREATARRNNLQYSGILIFLVLVFAGVFMSGKFKIPVRLAEGMIFFAFLLFFEFMLVLLDPYIERYSSGEPAYKLLFNAVLAGLIFPLHSFFEERLKGKLVKRS